MDGLLNILHLQEKGNFMRYTTIIILTVVVTFLVTSWFYKKKEANKKGVIIDPIVKTKYLEIDNGNSIPIIRIEQSFFGDSLSGIEIAFWEKENKRIYILMSASPFNEKSWLAFSKSDLNHESPLSVSWIEPSSSFDKSKWLFFSEEN